MPLTCWLGGGFGEAAEGVFEEGLVAEGGGEDAGFDVDVADPAATVALGGVPEAVLHAEVGGVGAGLPDAVEEGVGGGEGAGLRGGVVDAFRRMDLKAACVVGRSGLPAEEVDADVAEGGLGASGGAVGGSSMRLVPR